MSHKSVMLEEVLASLSIKDYGVYIDGTFGAGGYSRKILSENPRCKVIGIDMDPTTEVFADELIAEFPGRFMYISGNFSDLQNIIERNEIKNIHGIVLDLGFSNMQIEDGERGFSFMREGPLDMRMSPEIRKNAYNVVNFYNKKDLVEIFKYYGEEKRPHQIAEAIIDARGKEKIKTTTELADIIHRAYGGRGKIHPATKIFQAIRIYVNNEVENLVRAILSSAYKLENGGRLVIVSFHGLECRVIKNAFRTLENRYNNELSVDFNLLKDSKFKISHKKAITPSEDELEKNSNSRSAKLRILEKLKF